MLDLNTGDYFFSISLIFSCFGDAITAMVATGRIAAAGAQIDPPYLSGSANVYPHLTRA